MAELTQLGVALAGSETIYDGHRSQPEAAKLQGLLYAACVCPGLRRTTQHQLVSTYPPGDIDRSPTAVLVGKLLGPFISQAVAAALQPEVHIIVGEVTFREKSEHFYLGIQIQTYSQNMS